MKTIEFEGKKYRVEDGVNWAAKDNDGEIWAFTDKPNLTEDGCWYLDSYSLHSAYLLGETDDICWQDSLTKV